MTYAEQIKHPNWQKKRLEVLEANRYECQNCGNKDEQLHVHHPLYRRGAKIWEYATEELECLCTGCHKAAHELDDKIKHELALCNDKHRVLGYMAAMNAHNIRIENAVPISFETWEALQGAFDFLSTFSQDNRKEWLDAFESEVASRSDKTIIGYLGAITLASWKLKGVF